MKTDLAALARGASPKTRAAINAAMGAKGTKRAGASAKSRAAQASGAAFERDVFAALDALVACNVLAWWGHFGPQTKHLAHDRVIVTGHAPCDVVGCTSDGRAIVAEVKRHGRRVVFDGRRTHDAHVEPHQRAQLEATVRHGGVALLVVDIAGERAVIPWASVSLMPALHVGTARQWSAHRSMVDAIRAAIGERAEGNEDV